MRNGTLGMFVMLGDRECHRGVEVSVIWQKVARDPGPRAPLGRRLPGGRSSAPGNGSRRRANEAAPDRPLRPLRGGRQAPRRQRRAPPLLHPCRWHRSRVPRARRRGPTEIVRLRGSLLPPCPPRPLRRPMPLLRAPPAPLSAGWGAASLFLPWHRRLRLIPPRPCQTSLTGLPIRAPSRSTLPSRRASSPRLRR